MRWSAMGRFDANFSLTILRIRAYLTRDNLLFQQRRRRLLCNRHLPGFANGWREHEVPLRREHRNSIRSRHFNGSSPITLGVAL
jgi:hypothetical protein